MNLAEGNFLLPQKAFDISIDSTVKLFLLQKDQLLTVRTGGICVLFLDAVTVFGEFTIYWWVAQTRWSDIHLLVSINHDWIKVKIKVNASKIYPIIKMYTWSFRESSWRDLLQRRNLERHDRRFITRPQNTRR